MDFKFYYSYKEFVKNFESNFKEYQTYYPDADKEYFKKKYLQEYQCFYQIKKDKVKFKCNFFTQNNTDLSEGHQKRIILDDNKDFTNWVKNTLHLNDDTLLKIKPLFLVSNYMILDKILYENFQLSVPKIVEFLSSPIEINPVKQIQKTNFKTKITQTELVELVKSLVENKTIQGSQKELIVTFADFFGIKVNNQDQLLQSLKKRNVNKETIFLDKLKDSLMGFISKE